MCNLLGNRGVRNLGNCTDVRTVALHQAGRIGLNLLIFIATRHRFVEFDVYHLVERVCLNVFR